MPIQRIETAPHKGTKATAQTDEVPEYPVREYIGAMALELAQMARWASDEPLAQLLDDAATLSAERLKDQSIEMKPAARHRPA